MQHQLVKCSLLILLCSSGVPASAEKDANVKQKLSMAPVTNFLPPAPGRTRLSQSNVRTGQASRLKKLARSSYPQNHLQKGFYFKQKGQINEALLEFILASEENPRDVRAFYEQAQIFKQTGKTKLAKSALEQALSVSPGDTQARSFLVALHFESGNLLGAAAEVGKMLTLNQAAPQKAKAVQTEHQSLSTLPPTAPGTSSSIFKTANSAEPDPTSAWLHQAAGISEPPKAVAANSNLNDVLSSIGSGSGSARQNNNSLPDRRTDEELEKARRLQSVLSQWPSPDTVNTNQSQQGKAAPTAQAAQAVLASIPAKAAPTATATLAAPATQTTQTTQVQSGSISPGLPAQSGLFFRMRSGATHAVSGLTRPVPTWVKSKIPFVPTTNQSTADATSKRPSQKEPPIEPQKDLQKDSRQESQQESRTQAVISWIKNNLPFAAQTKNTSADNSTEKPAGKVLTFLHNVKEKLPRQPVHLSKSAGEGPPKTAAVFKLARQMKSKIPFVHRENTGTATPVVSKAMESSAVEKKTDLPPAVIKALEGKFNTWTDPSGKTHTLESGSAAELLNKEKQKEKQIIRRILTSLPEPPVERETPVASSPGPDYGLLKNNALSHISMASLPEMPDAQPSLLDRVMKEAGKTFSGLVPRINWSWTTLSSIAGLSHGDSSPAAVIAAVPPLKQETAADIKPPAPQQNVHPAPVPLNVARILNKLSAPAPPPAPQILPRLSASMPVAAAPSSIDEFIPRPVCIPETTGAALPAMASAPATAPGAVEPLSRPQSLPEELLGPALPVVQNVIAQVQPLLKPAFTAAAHLFQSLTPLSIPKARSLPEPVPAAGAAKQVENIVPAPVSSAAGKKYFPDLAILPVTSPEIQPVAPPVLPAATPVRPPAPEPKLPSSLPHAAPTLPAAMPASVPEKLSFKPPVTTTIAPLATITQTVEKLLPQAVANAAAATSSALPVPGAAPQSLSASATLVGPRSAPQAPPQNFLYKLPLVVQNAINQAQPLVQPALTAAGNLVQSIAPLSIPKTDSLPEPVKSSWADKVNNTVPVPVGADMQKYFPSLDLVPSFAQPAAEQVDGLSAGTARRLIDVQKTKSGAFTFMKPIIDSDRAYLLGTRQVRTMVAPGAKKPETKPAPPPEDAITKRMRYLLEHGTGNLRRGEAFMFSEETGEGTLFLPDGTTERRKLQGAQDAEKVMRERRPDIMTPKDVQYTLTLLGKLLPPQQQPNNDAVSNPLSGPTLEQLMSQMNQSSKGFFGWLKKSLNINN